MRRKKESKNTEKERERKKTMEKKWCKGEETNQGQDMGTVLSDKWHGEEGEG